MSPLAPYPGVNFLPIFHYHILIFTHLPPRKQGNTEDPGNYQVATLVPSKIMEKILPKVMLKPMKTKMIRDSQYGFTKGKSCLTKISGLLQWSDCLSEQRATCHHT